MRMESCPKGDATFMVTLVGSTFLMGSSFVASKMLIQGGVPSLLLVGWRFFVAAWGTMPLLVMNGRVRNALLPPGTRPRDVGLAARRLR